jgi:hypothetical protein
MIAMTSPYRAARRDTRPLLRFCFLNINAPKQSNLKIAVDVRNTAASEAGRRIVGSNIVTSLAPGETL